jgi:excisionase family DNA binding protein
MAKVERELPLDEAAQRLGVHYMTAYRYVRLGRLPARKVDGRWRVRLTDLQALRQGRAAPAAGAPRRNLGAFRARLRDRILEGDEGGAWAITEAALAGGAAPVDVYVDLFAPTMRDIGDRWAEGRVTVGGEHRATAVAVRLVGRMGPRFARRGRRRGTVVLAAPPGEAHGLPSALVADVLRGEGYAVVDHGANTPIEEVVAAARDGDRLIAVGVSVGTTANERAARATVRAVREALPGVPIFVGGPAVPDDAAAHAMGADAWAADARGLAQALDGLEPVQR